MFMEFIGKTTAVIGMLSKSRKIVHYFVDRHVLGKELLKKIQVDHPRFQGMVIEGRGRPGMCEREDIINGERVIDLLPKQGMAIESTLCEREGSKLVRCPHYADCRYIKQFRDALGSDFLIMPHDYLVTESKLMSKLPIPNHIVIDESFWQKFIDSETITMKLFDRFLKHVADKGEKDVLLTILQSLRSGVPLKTELTQNGVSLDRLIKARKTIKQKLNKKLVIKPGVSDAEISKIIKSGYGKYRKILKIFDCIIQDYKSNRDIIQSVTVVNKKTKDSSKGKRKCENYLLIKTHSRKELVHRYTSPLNKSSHIVLYNIIFPKSHFSPNRQKKP
jgi:hypothetical protein